MDQIYQAMVLAIVNKGLIFNRKMKVIIFFCNYYL